MGISGINSQPQNTWTDPNKAEDNQAVKFLSQDASPRDEARTKSLAADKDLFLQIFTTTMKYMNPLDPPSDSEFTGQMVAWAGIEQSVQTNQKLDDLVTISRGEKLQVGADMIGKEVTYDSSFTEYGGGDRADFNYEINPGESESVGSSVIFIKDSKGVIVNSAQGESATGVHNYIWNGRDFNNKRCEPGDYRIEVQIFNEDGQRLMDAPSIIKGTVKESTFANNKVFVRVNNKNISSDRILSIRDNLQKEEKEHNYRGDN